MSQEKNMLDAEGQPAKIHIPAEVFCGEQQIPATVYVHLKGRLRARVTHIDVEGPHLQRCAPHLCEVKAKTWPDIYHVPNGFALSTDPTLTVKSKRLAKHIPEEPKRVMVGGKGTRGIFIGLAKEIKDAIRREFDPRLEEGEKAESDA